MQSENMNDGHTRVQSAIDDGMRTIANGAATMRTALGVANKMM